MNQYGQSRDHFAKILPVFYVSKMYAEGRHKLVFYNKSATLEVHSCLTALLIDAGAKELPGTAPKTPIERKIEKLLKKGKAKKEASKGGA